MTLPEIRLPSVHGKSLEDTITVEQAAIQSRDAVNRLPIHHHL
jgi:hypothetical protein